MRPKSLEIMPLKVNEQIMYHQKKFSEIGIEVIMSGIAIGDIASVAKPKKLLMR